MGPSDTLPKSLSWLASLAQQLPMRRRFEVRAHIFQVMTRTVTRVLKRWPVPAGHSSVPLLLEALHHTPLPSSCYAVFPCTGGLPLHRGCQCDTVFRFVVVGVTCALSRPPCPVEQARNLSAADSNGSSDPYVVVRYGGTIAKTAVRPVTTNPIWFQTLVLTAEMLPPKIAPKVCACRRCHLALCWTWPPLPCTSASGASPS
jgi:hypothetical protein